MNTPATIVSSNSVVVVMDGRNYTAKKDTHPNFEKILEAVKAKDWNSLPNLFDVKKSIVSFSQGLVKIVDGVLYFKDQVLHNTLTTRILAMLEEGFEITPMVNFLQNLMNNPSKTAVDELYLFLETGNMPITEDGHFLAYKRIRGNFKDIHSNSMDNSVGQVVQLTSRNMVDDNRDRTCSQGLHFCSIDYLPHFSSNSYDDKIIIVKINPADVVSIPSDYANTKGRCWKYEVVGLHVDKVKSGTAIPNAFEKSVDTRYSPPTPTPTSAPKLPERDEYGRFLPKGAIATASPDRTPSPTTTHYTGAGACGKAAEAAVLAATPTTNVSNLPETEEDAYWRGYEAAGELDYSDLSKEQLEKMLDNVTKVIDDITLKGYHAGYNEGLVEYLSELLYEFEVLEEEEEADRESQDSADGYNDATNLNLKDFSKEDLNKIVKDFEEGTSVGKFHRSDWYNEVYNETLYERAIERLEEILEEEELAEETEYNNGVKQADLWNIDNYDLRQLKSMADQIGNFKSGSGFMGGLNDRLHERLIERIEFIERVVNNYKAT